MPTFDFKCNPCNTTVELIVTDTPFPKCEKCGEAMTKVYTPPAVHFKGGGWGGNYGG